jgi:hypothetical protein
MHTVLFCVAQLEVAKVKSDIPIRVEYWVLRQVKSCQLCRSCKAAAVEAAHAERKKNSRPHGHTSSLRFQADAVNWRFMGMQEGFAARTCLLETRLLTCSDDTPNCAVCKALSDDKWLERLEAARVVCDKPIALARSGASADWRSTDR